MCSPIWVFPSLCQVPFWTKQAILLWVPERNVTRNWLTPLANRSPGLPRVRTSGSRFSLSSDKALSHRHSATLCQESWCREAVRQHRLAVISCAKLKSFVIQGQITYVLKRKQHFWVACNTTFYASWWNGAEKWYQGPRMPRMPRLVYEEQNPLFSVFVLMRYSMVPRLLEKEGMS